MSLQISVWIGVCLAVIIGVLVILRHDKLSLGLPFAFVALISLQHLPGAWVYVLDPYFSFAISEVNTGIRLTAFAFLAFLTGLLAPRFFRNHRKSQAFPGARARHENLRRWQAHRRRRDGPMFWLFCLIGGWFLLYGLGSFVAIPSIGAALDKGAAIWMLGVMLGLQNALHRKNALVAAMWASTLLINAILTLVLIAFLSGTSTVAGIVLSFLAVTTRRLSKVILILIIISVIGLTAFVNYFGARNQIRDTVWGGASISKRLDVIGDVFAAFKLFDPSDHSHLNALDRRLNQNYFVGTAAKRLDSGAIDYLKGRSLVEGMLSLVPRAIWPEKPIFAGSGTLVVDATGLDLSQNTAWGVGSVMEFYINFGLPGLLIGFLLLGAAIGILDRQAAVSLRDGHLTRVFICFLPCVALIQPLGSMVELFSGAAAASVAAFVWRWCWMLFARNLTVTFPVGPTRPPTTACQPAVHV